MATIRPFMGIRPAPEYAKDVAALPYDVMNTEEAREMVKGNPYSFLPIDITLQMISSNVFWGSRGYRPLQPRCL